MSSKSIYHNHHIIPKHMGGTDEPSNLIRLTIEEHAEAHRKLYEEHGRWQDRLAWKSLSGLISCSESKRIAIKTGAILGGKAVQRKIKTPDGIFESIASAANHYGVTRQAIYKKLKKPHFDHWIYLD